MIRRLLKRWRNRRLMPMFVAWYRYKGVVRYCTFKFEWGFSWTTSLAYAHRFETIEAAREVLPLSLQDKGVTIVGQDGTI